MVFGAASQDPDSTGVLMTLVTGEQSFAERMESTPLTFTLGLIRANGTLKPNVMLTCLGLESYIKDKLVSYE